MIDPQAHTEMLDDTKYAYAIGWSNLQAIADRISVLAHQSDPVSPGDRDRIHDDLRELSTQFDWVYDLLHPHPAAGQPCGSDDVRYSDGSAVFSATPPAHGATTYPPGAEYCGDLGRGDDFEPGTLVIVNDPPHVKARRAAIAQ